MQTRIQVSTVGIASKFEEKPAASSLGGISSAIHANSTIDAGNIETNLRSIAQVVPSLMVRPFC
jgi:hypothetical protein